ncbi:MAG: extracellular solute-binding protein [Eubacteriales bacterium]|nr:extracellular solute-binding protein [Eubacteriales bacterium]
MKCRKGTALLLAGSLALGLAGCGSSKENGENQTAEQKLTIWAWDEAFNIPAAKEATEIYQSNHPGAEVDIVTMAQNDIVAKLNTSLASGSYEGLPDLVLIEDYRIQGYLKAYSEEFSDLSDVVKNEDFASYKTGINQYNGVTYGCPFDSGVAGLFYRTDYVEQAGYTQEDMQDLTWEKYIEIGKAVKEACGKDMLTLDPSDVQQIRMFMQSAGTWYTDEEGRPTLEGNQGVLDAVNTYKALMDAGIVKLVSDWNQFVSAFNNGDVASIPTGCWISPSVIQAEDQAGKWAIAPFPRMGENPDSVNATSIGGAGWYILKNVGHEEEAKTFLKETFASSTELMNTLAEEINLVSTLNAASECENYAKPQEFYGGQKIFQDFAAWTAEVPRVNYGESTYQMEDFMKEILAQVIAGADPEEVLADYQVQAEAALGQ